MVKHCQKHNSCFFQQKQNNQRQQLEKCPIHKLHFFPPLVEDKAAGSLLNILTALSKAIAHEGFCLLLVLLKD